LGEAATTGREAHICNVTMKITREVEEKTLTIERIGKLIGKQERHGHPVPSTTAAPITLTILKKL
jgi:hypothetical protein